MLGDVLALLFLAALVLGWMEKGLFTVAAVACAVAFAAGFLPL